MVLRRFVRRGLHAFGYDVHRVPAEENNVVDLDPGTQAIVSRVSPYTMTSVERVAAMCDATRHIARHRIPGAIVECGVWRGGSMMAAALTLLEEAASTGGSPPDRKLWLYDTFTGMGPPGEHDVTYDGVPASEEWVRKMGDTDAPWCDAGADEVEKALASTEYPGPIVLVPGRIEETLPARLPGAIALLRLDVDWYEPTRHALEQLYPLLSPGGILILDDHGHWQGARRAAEELFAAWNEPLFLARIDYTGRVAVKPSR